MDPFAAAVVSQLDRALSQGNRQAFGAALRALIEVHGGFSAVARAAPIHRSMLHKLASGESDVRLSTLLTV